MTEQAAQLDSSASSSGMDMEWQPENDIRSTVQQVDTSTLQVACDQPLQQPVPAMNTGYIQTMANISAAPSSSLSWMWSKLARGAQAFFNSHKALQQLQQPGEQEATTVPGALPIELPPCNRIFEMPEIVQAIVLFLDKSSVASCCRVSQLWFLACEPLLWREIQERYWASAEFSQSVRSKSHYVRSLRCGGRVESHEVLDYQWPNLRSITLLRRENDFQLNSAIISMAASTLVRLSLNKASTTLCWDTVKATQGLKLLTKLKIARTSMTWIKVAAILKSCENIEYLNLSEIEFWESTPTAPDNGDLTSQEEEDSVSMVGNDEAFASNPMTRIKCLALRNVGLKCKPFIALLRVCPELMELSIARNGTYKVSPAANDAIKKYCPRLYALDLDSCKEIDPDSVKEMVSNLPQLTVLGLSGTKIGDGTLTTVAEKCRRLKRLDIQYCTSITSSGLHRFLCQCSNSLVHLEALGVTLDPDVFDGKPWACTNLRVLFVHIGLFAARTANAPITTTTATTSSSSPSPSSTQADDRKASSVDIDVENNTLNTEEQGGFRRIKSSTDSSTESSSLNSSSSPSNTEPGPSSASTSPSIRDSNSMEIDDEYLTGSDTYSTSTLSSASDTESSGADEVQSPEKRTLEGESEATEALESVSHTDQSHEADREKENCKATAEDPCTHSSEEQSMLHPIQNVKNVLHLGLMGWGLQFTKENPERERLLAGFRAVTRLNVTNMYQIFKREDLLWLLKMFPELRRIDADKYNISNRDLKWLRETYPHIYSVRDE
ncbi:hypothetical protein BGW38_008192 [Lunasporangiospora selenospora]|uniref:F-box/LRR-repeat protein 15-like leucin rich repeat domain-containing protein n=1 Tax=Lunasporangiospora selenospora TaxID=979761 RepID=A0A9P6FZ69_9FUNG|nr:hypothetical protein BGW38_008192 [Lunasporangiospora selenospora]